MTYWFMSVLPANFIAFARLIDSITFSMVKLSWSSMLYLPSSLFPMYCLTQIWVSFTSSILAIGTSVLLKSFTFFRMCSCPLLYTTCWTPPTFMNRCASSSPRQTNRSPSLAFWRILYPASSVRIWLLVDSLVCGTISGSVAGGLRQVLFC